MKKKTQKIIAIGLASTLIGSRVIAPCARAFATPSVIYTQGSTCPRVTDSRLVQFKDPNFKTAVLRSLKAQGIIDESATEVTKEQALKVTNFYSSGKELSNSYIFDISGIEEFKNLEQLYLDNNNITDISPLKNLTKLYNLWLGKNNISDISALSNLHELVTLSLYGNHIIDIQPLLGLKKITALSLYNQTLTQSIYEKTSKLNIKYIDDLDFTVSPELGSVTNGNFTFNNLPKTRSGIIRFQSKSATVAGVTTSRNGGGIGYEGFIKLDFSSFGLPASESQTQDTSQSLLAYLTDAATIRKTTNYRNADNDKRADYEAALAQGSRVYQKLSSTPSELSAAARTIERAFDNLNGDKKQQLTLENAQAQIQTLTQTLKELQTQIKALEAQSKLDKAKIQELTDELDAFDKALQKLRADKLNSDAANLAKIQGLKDKIIGITTELAAATKDKNLTQTQLVGAKHQIDDLCQALAQAKAQDGADKAKIAKLEDELASAKAAYEKLAQDKQTSDNQNLAQIAELTNTLGVLRNQVHSLEDEKSSLESQIAALKQQLQDLSKQADTCSVNDEAKAQEIKSLKEQLAHAREELEKLTQDKNTSDTDKQKALDELRAKLNELQTRNNHVLPSSTSSRNASNANSKPSHARNTPAKSKSAPTVKDSSKATSGNLAKTADVFSLPAFLSLCSTGLLSATLGIKLFRKKKDV